MHRRAVVRPPHEGGLEHRPRLAQYQPDEAVGKVTDDRLRNQRHDRVVRRDLQLPAGVEGLLAHVRLEPCSTAHGDHQVIEPGCQLAREQEEAVIGERRQRSVTSRVVRRNSSVPTSCSSWRIATLTGG
jgi:hypothetical protein